jgi:NTE family protein
MSADHIVGTSAGSMIGALCASGVPPWFMVAHSAGETFDGLLDVDGRPAHEADRSAGAVFRLHRAAPPIGPGSWKLALKSLSNPRGHTPGAILSGWLPRGIISTEPLKETIRRVVPRDWSAHPNLWVMACDYATGRRVAFGSERSPHPDVDLANAVAASCAIPGFYYPVTIDGRRYVDGGMHSASNLDVLRHKGLDLVICMNPTSSRHSSPRRHPVERLHAFMRSASGRRLGSERKRLEDEGTKVVLIQPTAADLEIMGGNLMSTKRRHEVLELATRTVAQQLRRPAVQRALAGLPPGDPDRIRKPAGPPSTWPRPKWVPERETSAA